MEVVEEPLCRTLQTHLLVGIAQRSHHSHRLLDPVAGGDRLNAVVLLLTGSEKRTVNSEKCHAHDHSPK